MIQELLFERPCDFLLRAGLAGGARGGFAGSHRKASFNDSPLGSLRVLRHDPRKTLRMQKKIELGVDPALRRRLWIKDKTGMCLETFVIAYG